MEDTGGDRNESFEEAVGEERGNAVEVIRVFQSNTKEDVIVSREQMIQKEHGERKRHEHQRANNYEHGCNGCSGLTIATQAMNNENKSTQPRIGFFPIQRIVTNASQPRRNGEAFPSESEDKFHSLYEAREQQEPFVLRRMLHPSFVNYLDLPLKLSPSSNAFRDIDCTIKEGKRLLNFLSEDCKENSSQDSPRFVSRPCSIFSKTSALRSWDFPETGNPKLSERMLDKKLFQGWDVRGAQRGVNQEGCKRLEDGHMWNDPPNNPDACLSSLPEGIKSGPIQNFGVDTKSNMSNQQAHAAVSSYEFAPNLEKSVMNSMIECDDSEKIQEGEGTLTASLATSRNSGYASLDLLIHAIQVTTGHLLGEEDIELPECLPEEEFQKSGLHDTRLSARERKPSETSVVKKRVLRRARSAFKKPDFQESAIYSAPKRGIKRQALEQHKEDYKIKLSAIGADSPFQDKIPIIRSKRGRSHILPTKFYDSVLQSWKRKSRRQLKLT